MEISEVKEKNKYYEKISTEIKHFIYTGKIEIVEINGKKFKVKIIEEIC